MPEQTRNCIEKGIEAYDKYKNMGNPRNIRDYAKNINKIEKTLNGIGKTSKAANVVGGIAIAVDAGMTVKRVADKYSKGDKEGGMKEITEFVASWYGGAKAVTLAEPFNMWVALSIGSVCPPAGVAAFFILSMAEFWVGAKLGEAFNDAMYDIFDWFRDALAQRVDPLIVDLDGDGVETISIKSNVHFDFDGDKNSESMGWVSADDGLLVYDENDNGKIDGGNELFGNASSISLDEFAANGFLALANYDENADGVMDENDYMYSKIQVWRDVNSNGKTESGELLSLREAGIKSINLNYVEQSSVDEMGNEHNQISTYTDVDGNERDIHDVWFDMDSIDTEINDKNYAELEETEETIMLPDLKGSGKVPSLHQAMLRDETGKLVSLVRRFESEKDEEVRRQIVSEVIMRWAGVYDADPYGRGNSIKDARRLETIEKFLGQKFNHPRGGANPIAAAAERIEKAYSMLVDICYYQLKVQTDYDELFAKVQFDYDDEKDEIIVDYSGMADVFAEMNSTDSTSSKEKLSDWMESVYGSGLIDVENRNFDGFINKVSDISDDFENITKHASAEVIKASNEKDELYGYGGDDLIYAYAGNDKVYGGDGEDTLAGGDDDDKLYGEAGNDILYGGNGNDFLDGGLGNDTVYGGDGDDTFFFDAESGNDTIMDFDIDKDKVLMAEGISLSDLNCGINDSNLKITVAGHKGELIIKDYAVSAAIKPVNVEFADGTIVNISEREIIKGKTVGSEFDDKFTILPNKKEVDAGLGDDVITGTVQNDIIRGGRGRDTIRGDKGNDQLFGDNGRDDISGGDGDDVIYGGDSNDTLRGNIGNDVIYGGDAEDNISGNEGEDTLYGENGRDTLYGGDANDVLYGGKGLDILNGGSGDDELYGDESDDTLSGEKGNDILDGGIGNDILNGGNGNDVYVITKGNGNEVINEPNEQNANNIIRFSEGIRPEDLEYSDTNRNLIITIKETGETITINDIIGSTNGIMLKQFTLQFADGTEINLDSQDSPIKNFIGSDEGEKMYAAAVDTKIYGNAGDDFIYGNSGNDELLGGVDKDELRGNAGNDILFGAQGNDVLYGGNDNDTLYGGANNDELNGENGDDVLYGDSGDDTLNGGNGNDVLDGGAGNDTLNGGAGDDAYVITKGNGNKVISDLNGSNTICFSEGIKPEDLEYRDTNKNLMITIKETGETVTIKDIIGSADGMMLKQFKLKFAGGTEINLDSENGPIRKFVASDEGQSMYAAALDSKMFGIAGNDFIYGNKGNDTLYGGDGRDELRGNDGDDTLNGGSGNDLLYGGNDNDKLYGGSDNDTLYGDAGDDSLYGEKGDDTLNGGNGNDILDGGTGNDNLYGGAGNDTYLITKGNGNKVISDSSDQSIVRFSEEIKADDLLYSYTNRNLVITIKETGENVTINDIISSSEGVMLKQFTLEFADGTTINLDDKDAPIRVERGTEDSETLYAAAVESTLYGETGDDTLNGNKYNDVLYGGSGNDTLNGNKGDDILYGEKGDDKLYGQDGNDVIYTGEGTDTIYGGTGDDILYDQGGNNNLYGENGDDTYIIGRKSGKVYISDNDGTNYVQFADGITIDDVTFAKDRYHLYVTVKDTDIRMKINNCISNEKYANFIFKFDGGNEVSVTEILAGTVEDYVEANAGEGVTTVENGDKVIINGTSREDKITVKVENAVVNGGLANDTIYGSLYDDTIYGGSGNDTVSSGNGNDIIFGEDGNDNLSGGAGNDTIYGGADNDVIYGSTGNDVIYGGSENDKLYGEAGDDVLYSGSGNDSLTGGAGNDTLIADSGKNNLYGSEGDDKYIILNRDSINTISDNSGLNEVMMPEGIRKGDVRFTTDNKNLRILLEDKEFININYFVNKNDYRNITLVFDDGEKIELNDKDGILNNLVGTDTSDTMYSVFDNTKVNAGKGDDKVYGTSGADVLYGESGNDELVGNAGQDKLYGGKGDDRLNGGLDNDVLYGGAGNDNLYGNEGDDVIYAELGDDVVYGGAGNDVLNGGTGKNTLYGEAGDDIFEIEGVQDTTIKDYYGDNKIKYLDDISIKDLIFERSGNNLIIKCKKTSSNVTIYNYCINDSNKAFTLLFNDGTELNLAQESKYIKELFGGNDKDNITAIVKNSIIHGNDNDDNISGIDGDEELYGDAGEDKVYGNKGDDVLHGGEDNDKLYGGEDNDMIYGDNGNDIVNGENGNDRLYGGTGNDTLNGGNGDDILDGGTGTDILRGNDGDDTYIIGRNYDVMNISDSEGNNILRFAEDITIEDLQYQTTSNDFIINVKDGNTKVIISDFVYREKNRNFTLEFTNGESINMLDENGIASKLVGSDEADTLYVAIAGKSVDSKAGDDIIYGSSLSDTLFAGSGYDKVDAGSGDDLISGGTGDDILYGRDGNDIINGDKGNDTIYGGNGVDTLNGGDGDDNIEGDADSDTIYGGNGDDYITGGYGNDVIYGENGDDAIYGGNGDDTIYPGIGSDYIEGGKGNDIYVVDRNEGTIVISDTSGDNTLRFADDITSKDITFDTIANNLFIKVNNSSRVVIIKNYNNNVSARNIAAEFSDGTKLTVQEFKNYIKDKEIVSPFASLVEPFSEKESHVLINKMTIFRNVADASDVINKSLNSNLSQLIIDNYSTLTNDKGIDQLRDTGSDNISKPFTDNIWMYKA